MRLCSFNLKVYFKKEEQQNLWVNRLPRIVKQLSEINADLYGFQEVKLNLFEDMVHVLADYDYEYLSRDGVEDEGTPIFYLRTRFELLDKGSYYLNTRPDTPGRGWEVAYLQVASYVCLKDKVTGKVFSYFNSHLDDVGEIARQEGY